MSGKESEWTVEEQQLSMLKNMCFYKQQCNLGKVKCIKTHRYMLADLRYYLWLCGDCRLFSSSGYPGPFTLEEAVKLLKGVRYESVSQ